MRLVRPTLYALLLASLTACGASRPDPATVDLAALIDNTPQAWGVKPASAVNTPDITLDAAGAPVKAVQQPWTGRGFGGTLSLYLYADDEIADTNFEFLKRAHDQPNIVSNLGEEGYLAAVNSTTLETAFRRCNVVVLLQVGGTNPYNTPEYLMALDKHVKTIVCP